VREVSLQLCCMDYITRREELDQVEEEHDVEKISGCVIRVRRTE